MQRVSVLPAWLLCLPLAAVCAMPAVAQTVPHAQVTAPTGKDLLDTQTSEPATDKPVTRLDGVTVSALPENSRIVPAAVLDGTKLDQHVSASIGQTVSSVPGVQSTALGQAVGRPVIHGMSGPRVAVTENGMSSGDVSGISQDHAVSVPPFLAKRIEVLKGPATLLYGSGAIGGVVNVIDGRIPEQAPYGGFAGRVSAQYDSGSKGHTEMFRADAGSERLVLHFDGMRRDDGDYAIPGGRLANSQVQTRSGALGVSTTGAWGFLGMAISRYLDDYGSPAEPGDPAAGEPPVTLKMAQTRYQLKGQWKSPLPGIRSVRMNAGHTDYRHVEYEDRSPGTTFTLDADTWKLLAEHLPLGGWKGSFGLQHMQRDFAALGEETFVPPTRTRNTAAFLVEQHAWDRLQLDLGARVEKQTSAPANHHKRDFTPISASFALGWQVAQAWHLILHLDHSQRAPAEEELFAHGPHEASATFEIGNPDLRVESANQLSLETHYEGSWLDARASIYNNRFDHYIYLADTARVEDDLPVRVWSQHGARFRGVDFEATAHLVQGRSGDWDLHVQGDRVRATLDGGGNLPRIPAARFGASLGWSRGDIDAGLGATRYFAQNDIAAHETRTAGFTLVDAHLNWTFHNGEQTQWQAFVNGRNLTDQTARLATSLFKDVSPLPGRSVSIGLRGWF